MSREYLCAGKILEQVLTQKRSFKSVCANSKSKVSKVEFALAAETMKYSSVLESLFAQINVTASQLDINPGIMYVMAYELLFGKRKIKGGGACKRAIMSIALALQTALQQMLETSGNSELSALLPRQVQLSMRLPKYVRVNTLKISSENGRVAVETILPSVKVDDLIPNLYALPADWKGLGEHPLVKSGELIIQDKASCMPSQILFDMWQRDPKRGDAIDACAAPGNKTSHLASLMYAHCQANMPSVPKQKKRNGSAPQRHCTVFAFDKSSERYALLARRMASAGANDVVKVANEDFLTVSWDDQKYSSVTAVMLDPSCSGSGVVRALDRVNEESDEGSKTEDSIQRLQQLSDFQLRALQHAMSGPNVRLIAYSTCSVHKQENEDVVASALHSVNGSGWTLVAPPCMASWPRRGISHDVLSADESACLVRCLPEDGLNGFFVALFQRSNDLGAQNALPIDEHVPVLENDLSIADRPEEPVAQNTEADLLKPTRKRPLQSTKVAQLGNVRRSFCKKKARMWRPLTAVFGVQL